MTNKKTLKNKLLAAYGLQITKNIFDIINFILFGIILYFSGLMPNLIRFLTIAVNDPNNIGEFKPTMPSSILMSPPMMPFGYGLFVITFILSFLFLMIRYIILLNIDYELLKDPKKWKFTSLLIYFKVILLILIVFVGILLPLINFALNLISVNTGVDLTFYKYIAMGISAFVLFIIFLILAFAF
jgi:hypothetical protein